MDFEDIPEDYDLIHDEAILRAEEDGMDDHASGSRGPSGVDPLVEDSDEELDDEPDDGDELEPEDRPIEPVADDVETEEEDPSEDEGDDDGHEDEAPIEPVPVEDPLEIAPVEVPADPAPTEAPAGEEVVWTDIEMHPQPVVPAPPVSPVVTILGEMPVTPPDSPIVGIYSDDELVWGTPPVTPPMSPLAEEIEPDTPPPSPVVVPVITVYEHDLIVAHHTSELTGAHARVDELRLQLAAERDARFQDHRRR
jgi:hypothetical protein